MIRRLAPLALLALLAACGKTQGTADAGPGKDAGPGVDAGQPASPVVTAVSPATGPSDGGTQVSISGANFAQGARVSFGGAQAAGVTVASASQITCTTPPGPAGPVNVVVVNPDTRVGTKTGAFTYVAPASGPRVGWCRLQFPADTTGAPGAPLDLYTRVYAQGVTDQAGQGSGVHVQAGVSLPDGGFDFQDATFNVDSDNGANDEYKLSTLYPAAVGSYLSLARAQLNGGDWTYCEVDGPHDAIDPLQAGKVTVSQPQAGTVDWCNLQAPQQATLHPSDPLSLYGQVYKAGLTEAAGAGAGVEMQAALGYPDGGWDWQPAHFNTDVGNNDEYQLDLTTPGLGDYGMAFRARLNGGDWTYCEPDGPHAQLDPQAAGHLSVVEVPPAGVAWCNLQFPQQASGAPGSPFTLFGQVYQPGVTEPAGQGAGIAMEAGLSLPDGGWAWSPAAYGSDQGNNDEYQWVTTLPADPGSYRTAYRASLDGGPWTYCEVDGPHAALDLAQAGSVDVVPAAPPKVGWCNLQFPLQASGAPGSPFQLYGQVYLVGVTEPAGQGAGIAMQGGISLADGGWSWTDAVFNDDRGNNDEYRLDTTTPAAPGTYLTAFRAQLDGGPWVYCESDGPYDQLDPTKAGTLEVQTSSVGRVGWCNLQFPAQATAHPGEPVDLYGRVFQAGVTDQVGQGAGVFMEAGTSLPDGGIGWAPASYNTDADGLNPGDHANDEYVLHAVAPAAGSYLTAFRAALDGGDWTYCETDGPHDAFAPTSAGTLTVTELRVAWCNLQAPVQASCQPGDPITFYGQVYQPGVTEPAGQGAGIAMEAGLSLPDGGWSWSATAYNVDVGNNDEYKWDATCPAAGSYLTAFRASLDGGPWTYCEKDGPHPALDPSWAGTLTAQ